MHLVRISSPKEPTVQAIYSDSQNSAYIYFFVSDDECDFNNVKSVISNSVNINMPLFDFLIVNKCDIIDCVNNTGYCPLFELITNDQNHNISLIIGDHAVDI